MSKDLSKLHYQMLRKTAPSGTTMDDALDEIKEKIQLDDVQPGEPVIIYYDDASGNTGAHLAVPTSGLTDSEDVEGFIFPNRREVFERMEEDETVTVAALIDLDERITNTSGDVQSLTERINNIDFGDLGDIVLTEDVTAMGVTAGAINNGKTIHSGTTFTDFIKALLIQSMDYTANVPTLNSNGITWSPTGTTIEVGTNVAFTLNATRNQGSFTASASNGFPSDKTNVAAGTESLGSITYVVKEGSTTLSSITTTESTTYTVNSVVEGTYSVASTMPYTGVTAASKGLKKNTNETSQASYSNGTATGATKSFNVRYKIYYGITSATTASDFVFEGSSTNVIGTPTSAWLNGDVTWQNWTNNGKNFFILVPTSAYLQEVHTSSTPDDIRSNFYPNNNTSATLPTKTITIGGNNTATYKLYFYKVQGGANTTFTSVKINKTAN